ncbi:hypothetical protein BDW67DRAFT_113130 [Aspergillus spinulosporus]
MRLDRPETKRNKYWTSQQSQALNCSFNVVNLVETLLLDSVGKLLSITHTISCHFSALGRQRSARTSLIPGIGMASPFAPGTNEGNISAMCVPIIANPSHAATIRTNIIPTTNAVTAIGTYMTTMLRRDGSPRGVVDIAKHPVIIHRGTRGSANKSAIVSLDTIVPTSDVDNLFVFTHAYL